MQRIKLERKLLLLQVPHCHRYCSSQRWPFPPTRYPESAPIPAPAFSFQQPYSMNVAPPPPPPPAFGIGMQQPPSSEPPRPNPWPVRFMPQQQQQQQQQEMKSPAAGGGEVSEAFTVLIDSFHKKGLVQEVDKVIQGMNAAHIMLSLASYRTLIDVYAEQGDLERMDAVYGEMRKATMRMSRGHHEQAEPPSAMHKQHASDLFAALMDQCHKRGLYDQVQHIHKAMKAAQLAIPIPMYNILMDTYSQLGDCDKMDAAYYEMRQSLARKRGLSSTTAPLPSFPPRPKDDHLSPPFLQHSKLPPPPPPPLPPPLPFHNQPRPFSPPPFQLQPPPPFTHFHPPPFHYLLLLWHRHFLLLNNKWRRMIMWWSETATMVRQRLMVRTRMRTRTSMVNK